MTKKKEARYEVRENKNEFVIVDTHDQDTVVSSSSDGDTLNEMCDGMNHQFDNSKDEDGNDKPINPEPGSPEYERWEREQNGEAEEVKQEDAAKPKRGTRADASDLASSGAGGATSTRDQKDQPGRGKSPSENK